MDKEQEFLGDNCNIEGHVNDSVSEVNETETGSIIDNTQTENNRETIDIPCDDVITEHVNSTLNKTQDCTESSKEKCVKHDTANIRGDHSPALVQIKIQPSDKEVSVCLDTVRERQGNEDTVELEYRIKEEDISSSSESDSSSSEDDNNVEVDRESDEEDRLKNKGPKKSGKPFNDDIKTKGELCLEDLPPIEELKITIDETTKLVPIGKVSSIIGILVVIESSKDLPPLNEDTILFLADRVAIGKVFEVFGPVGAPWYSIRFNSQEDIEKVGLTVGREVFCAPHVEDFTKYVFVNYLKTLKGSDASWEDNNEPPQKYIDYSDDEEERGCKAKNRAKDRNHSHEDQLPGAKRQRKKRGDKGQQQQQGFYKNNNTGQNWCDQNNQFTNGGQQVPRFGQRNHAAQRVNPPGLWPRGQRQDYFRNSGPMRHPASFPSGTHYTNQPAMHPGYQHGNFTQIDMHQQSFINGQPESSLSNGINRQCDNTWQCTGSFQTPPTTIVDHRFVQNSNNETTNPNHFSPQFVPPPSNSFMGNYRYPQASGPPPRLPPTTQMFPPRQPSHVFGGQPRFSAGFGQ